MKTVFKYHLQITDRPVIRMPCGARVLCVQLQNGEPFVWAIVDPDEDTFEERLFAVYGTGKPFSGGEYLGTVQTHGGDLVWHVFLLPGRGALSSAVTGATS